MPQKLQCFKRPARAVALALGVNAIKIVRDPPLRPVGPQRHKRPLGNAAVASLPILDVIHGHRKIMELLRLLVQVQHRQRQDHFLHRQLVERARPLHEVNGRVDVGAPLAHNAIAIYFETLFGHGEEPCGYLVF